MRNVKIISLLLVLWFAGCDLGQSINVLNPLTRKPDLVIDTVAYTRLPNCWQGFPLGTICGGPRFTFTVRISNVGLTDLIEPFYLSYSHSNVEFQTGYCSHTIRLNGTPSTIPPGESIIAPFETFIDDSTAQVLFAINTDDRFKSGVPLSKVDEARYDNNEYRLPMAW